jgi:hypothetical protein
MLSKLVRDLLGMLTLLMSGFHVWFLSLDEGFDPNTVLGAGLLPHLAIPFPLLVSAIRSIMRQQAVVERIVEQRHTGAQIITTYSVETAHGPEAVRLGWQRCILPALCFILWMAVFVFRSNWSIPLRW